MWGVTKRFLSTTAVQRQVVAHVPLPKDRPFLGSQGVVKQQAYVQLSAEQRAAYVPAQGDLTVEAFLKSIGRGCEEVSAKFATWKDLFCMTSEQMKAAGIPTAKRKYILTSREWFK